MCQPEMEKILFYRKNTYWPQNYVQHAVHMFIKTSVKKNLHTSFVICCNFVQVVNQ